MSYPRRSLAVCTASNHVVLALALVSCLLVGSASAQNYQNDINATSNWLASRSATLSDGGVTLSDGAVRTGGGSQVINPYFANLAVHGFVKNSAYYANVKNYMEWYWNHVSWPRHFNIDGCTVNPTSGDLYGAINDFNVTNTNPPHTGTAVTDTSGAHHPDSTDSYAATFLSLAWDYWQTGDTNARNYIKLITIGANGDRLDYVGEVVLATLQSNNLTCARPDFNIEYVEDNSEAYRGLQDLVNLYSALGATSKVNFYMPYVTDIQKAIASTDPNNKGALWNSADGDFYTYTTVAGVSGTVNWSTWFADANGPDGAVSEIFPIALGVISPTSQTAKNIWGTFQSHWRNQWTTLSADPDGFPWAIVGYTAALMGDTQDASTFVQNVEKQFVNSSFSGCANGVCKNWSVNEAGYFIRLCALLK